MYKKGDKILIKSMQDEPNYTGRIGIITRVDDIGQLYETWGSLAVVPSEDEFVILEKLEKVDKYKEA